MPSEQKYTDEYLKNIFLDKTKELGRPPKRREVKHGCVIAIRFGNGSYTEALKYFGYYNNTKSKAQIKREFEEKLQNSTCIEIYKMVLNGTLKYFPRFFWEDVTDQEITKILKYLFEYILKWNVEDIKEKMNSYILPKYKLQSLFNVKFKGSPFLVINFVYPNVIQEWELGCTPDNYWTKEKAIDVIKIIFEKENVDILTIRQPQLYSILKKYKKTSILYNIFDGSLYNLINNIYPNKYKAWELASYTPQGFWNIKTGVQAVKWMLEEKLQWTDEEIKKNYGYNIFRKFSLNGMLNYVFNCSPFKAINSTYPNKFCEEDFNNVPLKYWTKEIAIKSIKNFLDNFTEEEIKNNISCKFLIENGFRYPLGAFFKNSPFAVLDTLYPNKFNKKDLLKKIGRHRK